MVGVFSKEDVVENLPGVILISHGPLAVALLESAKLIAGKDLKNTAAFSIEEGDDPGTFGEAVKEAVYAYPEDTIVLIDLYGGTPCNQFMGLLKDDNLKIHAITGMNLPMLLETLFLREDKDADISEKLSNIGKEGIIDMIEFLKSVKK